MNPDYIKNEVEKLTKAGFKEDLIVLKHPDGRVTVLTSLSGGTGGQPAVGDYANGVNTVASIVLSLAKILSRPGMQTDIAALMLRHIEAEVRESKPVFQVGFRPTVEPGLEEYFVDPEVSSGDKYGLYGGNV